ncbi:MAG: DNA polymerase III subunit delta [Clostridiales bacterium]|nr:DNA polymerase III subunit delta [Clostridiales bacterium]
MAGFCDIIGHEQIIEHLKNAIARNKVSHAYIFNGPDHAGKRLLAEAFAMTLQCESVQREYSDCRESGQLSLLFPDRGLSPSRTDFGGMSPRGISEAARERAKRPEPCLECRSCRQAQGRNQPDILYVTHEKTVLSVDDIRLQVNQDILLRPYSSRYKIYIVDEAEKMNVQAQNALLKTLEEPPDYAVILLLTTGTDIFLPTIRSRCVTLNLRAVENEKIRDFLMNRHHVPDYQADLCVAFAQGNVGRAVILSSSDQFNELKDRTMRLLRRLDELSAFDLTKELEPVQEKKEQIPVFLDLLLLLFRDVLLFKAEANEEHLIFREQFDMIEQIANKSSFSQLNQILQAIETAERRIRANVSAPLTVELLMLSIKNTA